MNAYKCLATISLAFMLAGCSSGKTSSSPDTPAKSISPNASLKTSTSEVQPTDVNVALKFAPDPEWGEFCSPVSDPKLDTLGQKLVSCPLRVSINNQSQTEFGFNCETWFTLSNGERYYFEDLNGCENAQVLNPGKAYDLILNVELPMNNSITEMQLGSVSSADGTVFKGINLPIPSTCAPDKTSWPTLVICN